MNAPDESSCSDSRNGRTAPSLIARLARGSDDDAWSRLADLYGPLVFHWCRQSGLSNEDSADVMQNVFASVARGIDQFEAKPGSSFRGWLRVIARNAITDHFRRQAKQVAATGGTQANMRLYEIPEVLSDESLDEPSRSAESALLTRALRLVQVEFKEKTWQAFSLSVIEGQSTSEISEQLGISTASVRQAKSRVLRRLREELGEL